MAAAASFNGRRRRNVFPKLIEKNVVNPLETVYYRSKRGNAAEGRITSRGIFCKCCGKIFTMTGFEIHAGSKNKRASSNIFMADGRSIAVCLAQLKGVKDGAKENLELCVKMLGAITLCKDKLHNRDAQVGRFLDVYLHQSVFFLTFAFVLSVLKHKRL